MVLFYLYTKTVTFLTCKIWAEFKQDKINVSLADDYCTIFSKIRSDRAHQKRRYFVSLV